MSESTNPAKFSLKTLIILMTFVALLIALYVTSYRSTRIQKQLNEENFALETKVEQLENDLLNSIGSGLRTKYAEKMLFHIFSRPDEFPELHAALQNHQQRKVGISIHPLDSDDNLTYVNFYSMEQNTSSTPFCYSFLINDEPFQVLDNIAGEQSRMPRIQEETWFCGAGKDGSDRWYKIEDERFVLWPEENPLSND